MRQFKYEYDPEIIELFKYKGKICEGSFGYGRLVLFELGTHNYVTDICAYSKAAEKRIGRLIRPMWRKYQMRWNFIKRVTKR
jgi:hypothetical protein